MSCCKPPKKQRQKSDSLFHPKILTKFAMSVKNAIAFAVSTGCVMVDDEETKRRIAICNDCKHLDTANRCIKCGCFIVAKTALITESCPIDKW